MYFEIAEYNEAVQFLQAFGIINRESSYLDTSDWTVSRGEFINLALLCMGWEPSQSNTLENPFMDVTEEHSYAKAIIYAYHNNLLGKDIEKFFQPDIPLTQEFAARIGVNMTGRGVMLSGTKSYMSLADRKSVV